MGVLIQAAITEFHLRCPVNSINLSLMVLESASPRSGRWRIKFWPASRLQKQGAFPLTCLEGTNPIPEGSTFDI